MLTLCLLGTKNDQLKFLGTNSNHLLGTQIDHFKFGRS